MLRMNNFRSVRGYAHFLNASGTIWGSLVDAIQCRLYSRWVHRRPRRVYSSELVSGVASGEVKRFHELEIRNDSSLRTDTNDLNLNNFVRTNSKQEKLRNPEPKISDVSPFASKKQRILNREHNASCKESPALPKIPTSIPDVTDKIRQSATQLGVPIFVKLKDGDSKLSNIMTNVKSMKKSKSKEMALLEGRRLIQDSIDAGILPLMIFFSRVDDIKLLPLPATGIELYKVPYKMLSLWSDLSTCPGIMGIIKAPAIDQVKPSVGSLPIIVICDNIRDPGNLGSVLRTAAGVGCQKVILTKGCVELWEPKVLRGGMGAHFRIPIHANVSWDSINDHLGNNCKIYLADNKIVELDSNDNHQTSDTVENDQYITKKAADKTSGIIVSKIPFMPYYKVNFSSESCVVLVVGGETEGLSVNSYMLAQEKQGVRVTVPLNNNVESLNVSTALGIISFEVKRQFCLKTENLN